MSIVNTAGALPNSLVPAIASTLMGFVGFELLFSFLVVCRVTSAAVVLYISEVGREVKSNYTLAE